VGERVEIAIPPNGIHIMKKMRTVNEFVTDVTGEDTVRIAGGDFTFINAQGLEKGDRVRVTVPFDKITLTDSDDDGTVGGNISQSYYKGAYYQVQVYTDADEDFYLDTTDEWDLGDRVGIVIAPEDIRIERYTAEDSERDAEEADDAYPSTDDYPKTDDGIKG
jgi:spermidine/putrescine transport system ATP-binding protein